MIQSRNIPFRLLEKELASVSLPESGYWYKFGTCHQWDMVLTVVSLFFQVVHFLIALQSFVAFMKRQVVIYLAWRRIIHKPLCIIKN